MKNYVTGIAATVACLGLGGLLAGFVPDSTSFPGVWSAPLEDRGAFTRIPLNMAEERKPGLSSTVRMALSFQEYEPSEASTGNGGLLCFDGSSVSILTALGPQPVVPALLSGDVSGPKSFVQAESLDDRVLSSVWAMADLSGSVAVPEKILLHAELMPQLSTGPLCRVAPDPQSFFAEEVRHQPLVLRVGRYQATVERYADKYGLDVPLVLAIIQTESGFNPGLVSSRNAHGLMQVVPATAGDEVHRWLGRKGQPTASDLLNPDTNILYGTTYLHLLKDKHLEGIRNPQSLEYCIIASYNGGSGAVLRHFGGTREAAVAAINAMSPQDVLLKLTQTFPAAETRSFVAKVLESRRQYVMLAADTPGAAPAQGGKPSV